MVTPMIDIAPERIAEAKRLYELTSTPVPDIAAMMGVSRRTFDRRVIAWRWAKRGAPRHVTDRALVAAAPPIPPSPELQGTLAEKIHMTVERGLAAVNRILDKVGPADEAGAERSARTLAALTRALLEIKAITQPTDATPTNEADDDPVPRDIDEFRLELARRIRHFIEARRIGADRLSAEPEGSLE